MTLSDDFYGGKTPVSHPSERVPSTRPARVPSNTWAAWALAFLLLVAVFVIVAIAAALGGQTTWMTIGLVTVASGIIAVLFAWADRRELDAWGFQHTASPWLALLPPPVYLGVRGNRVWRRTAAGLTPFWVSIAVLLSLPFLLRLLEIWLVLQTLLPD